jgi:outer membrane lipoprotein SlyB
MKRLLLALLLVLPLSALGINNDDVIKMVRGGLGDATVIQAIDAGDPQFDTSPDGLVRLKQEGVSDAVIQRILSRRGGAPAAKAPACPECGTVTGVREIEKPRTTGTSTAVGAVLGGVLGYAAGGHGNRGVGTAVGAAGGAIAGNVYENRASANRTYEIGVMFDDGSSRVIHQDSHPSLSQGTRVRVVNGTLQRM